MEGAGGWGVLLQNLCDHTQKAGLMWISLASSGNSVGPTAAPACTVQIKTRNPANPTSQWLPVLEPVN